MTTATAPAVVAVAAALLLTACSSTTAPECDTVEVSVLYQSTEPLSNILEIHEDELGYDCVKTREADEWLHVGEDVVMLMNRRTYECSRCQQ